MLDLSNWEFYIVPTRTINEVCGDNKTISLSRIKKLGIAACAFDEIGKRIDDEIST